VTPPRTPGSPVPNQVSEVEVELRRVVERWHQLPLDRALSQAGRVRALIQSLADAVAEATGVQPSVVPDLGPATLMDQLTVLVHDATAAALTPAALTSPALTSREAAPREAAPRDVPPREVPSKLAKDLASLRRELR
jgi:hypothetical protein